MDDRTCVFSKPFLFFTVVCLTFFGKLFIIGSYTFEYAPAVTFYIQSEPVNASMSETTSVDESSLTTTNGPKSSPRPKRKVVIILAYMHTGSTFLGSVFQNHEDSFYEYENLRSLMYSTRARKVIHFLNGTDQQLRPHADVTNVHHNIHPLVGANAVTKMINCNHQDLDLATLANHYCPIRGVVSRKQFVDRTSVNRDVQSYFLCQEKEFGGPTTKKAVSALKYVENRMLRNTSQAVEIVRKCLPLLTDKCAQSKMVVEKFIRMTMKMVKVVLERNSDVKIIHLVRDPRAMLDSQVRKGDSGAQILPVFKGRAQYMCKQMADDYKLATELDKTYPGRILTVRYEDMMDFPLKTFTNMYNFIDIPFHRRDQQFVKSQSKANLLNYYNGSISLSTWRKHITPPYLNIIDKYCTSIYNIFGYQKLNNYSAIKDPKVKAYF